MKKRLLALFMCVCVIVHLFSGSIFAKAEVSSAEKETIDNQAAPTSLLWEGKVATLTDIESIYRTSDGQFLYKTSVGTLVRVDKVAIDTNNRIDLEETLQDHSIPEEVANKVRVLADKAKYNPNMEIYIIAPVTTQNTRSDTTTTDYMYNGYYIREYLVTVLSNSTGSVRVASGSAAASYIEVARNILIETGAQVSRILSFISTGQTIAEWLQDLMGADMIFGDDGDYVECKIDYMSFNKYTYVYDGEAYHLGAHTMNAIVHELTTRAHFADRLPPNDDVETTNSFSFSVTSPNYYNPAPIAVQNMFYGYEEPISYYFPELGRRLYF